MEKTSQKIAKYIDARNLICPLPVLKARKALQKIGIGKLIEIVTTDPVATIDIPHFCQQEGHELVETTNQEETTRFIIKRVS